MGTQPVGSSLASPRTAVSDGVRPSSLATPILTHMRGTEPSLLLLRWFPLSDAQQMMDGGHKCRQIPLEIATRHEPPAGRGTDTFSHLPHPGEGGAKPSGARTKRNLPTVSCNQILAANKGQRPPGTWGWGPLLTHQRKVALSRDGAAGFCSTPTQELDAIGVRNTESLNLSNKNQF